MKRKIIFISLVLVLGLSLIYFRFTATKEKPPAKDIAVQKNVLSATKNGFTVTWAGPFSATSIQLIDNLELKLTANEAKTKYSCSFLINAGFYTKEHTPVGLFSLDNKEVKGSRISSLFNGYFSVNRLFTPRITSVVPLDTVFALQTGPLLVENQSALPLTIRNDHEARRMAVGVTGENSVVFAAIYDKSSLFNGPLLAGTGDLLTSSAVDANINLADAINLDGGSASAFLSDTVQLTELSPVGSFLCVD